MTKPSTPGPKVTVAAVETTPMTAQQYEQAVTALATPGPRVAAGPSAERHVSR
jgi:hypothetical protein